MWNRFVYIISTCAYGTSEIGVIFSQTLRTKNLNEGRDEPSCIGNFGWLPTSLLMSLNRPSFKIMDGVSFAKTDSMEKRKSELAAYK